MGQRYTFNQLWIILIAAAISINFAYTFPSYSAQKTDSTYFKRTRSNAKIAYLKNLSNNGLVPGLKTMPLLKPLVYATVKPTTPREDDKLLSNVQTYPNVITDQLNLRYTVSRNANVTIKIVDVLGNTVLTFSQRVEPGEQKFTQSMTNRLTSGFYFLRVMAGTESVIKRITIL
ncbi:T9SS type A sorting domain-containing protein [Mucilaginibacter robiniae]|uniref:T9SS type A sorting domain-containing protein n=1 Tax=Mucilaginibacter robiniae TaxID=2728022 RepID=A0A7L5DUB5_9SPHI|nr:T9SS type A sorting domain-containing protein [Mucilaginibacter robiniae]QJD94705.1 T9SS type A sorting domain-containing protein [Mucilaginibacter robiniae]